MRDSASSGSLVHRRRHTIALLAETKVRGALPSGVSFLESSSSSLLVRRSAPMAEAPDTIGPVVVVVVVPDAAAASHEPRIAASDLHHA